MIAVSTLWFVALLVAGLVVMFGGLGVTFASGMASSGGYEQLANRGCLAMLIGVAAVVCAIVGLAGGFS